MLPASCKVGAVIWEVEEEINRALETEPDPGTGAREPAVHSSCSPRYKVLDWLHKARFACHLGRGRTSSLTKRYFWWDTLEKDVREYVAAAQQVSTQRPVGLFQPGCRPVPLNRTQGPKVWLVAKDIPLRSRQYIGPFETDRANSPSAVRLKLTALLLIHPTFHVSQLKPVVSSPAIASGLCHLAYS